MPDCRQTGLHNPFSEPSYKVIIAGLNLDLSTDKIGKLNPTRLAYLTTILGSLVGVD